MKEYQRHLILLIGFMVLLTGVFVFVLEFAPESLDITPSESPSSSNNSSVNLNQTYENDLLNRTVGGLKMLYSDSQGGFQYLSESGNSP